MPIIEHSRYRAPFLLSNGHLQTMCAGIFRRLNSGFFRRERLETDDGDFLDLDWAETGRSRIAILSHGLEGNSRRPYMIGMASALNRAGWDALAWNYRGCSGEPNRNLRMYHSGAIDDLDRVVSHVLRRGKHRTIALIGFSLGGNLTLLYLGSRGPSLDAGVRKAVAFSAPCDLRASALVLAKPVNYFYMRQFLQSFHVKIRRKMARWPDALNDDNFNRIRNFRDFDDRYTAPLHGFRDAEDYWSRCSSSTVIHRIARPTLIVNALNDPFLLDGCYPRKQAEKSQCVFLEVPASGGHVGFIQFGKNGEYWSEQRAVEFLNG
ncbi:MAG TPA: alpha/beta fold hydrolase [Nitrospirota bacterium]|nr:alpha/beta fold hydrolase [Nitrospirota bacterium]